MAATFQPFLKTFVAFAAASTLIVPAVKAQSSASEPQQTEPQQKVPAVSQRNRDAAEALFIAGARDLSNGRFPPAEKAFAKAIALNPTRSEYLQALLLAREHRVTDMVRQAASLRSSNPAAAQQLLAEAHSIDPTNSQVTQYNTAAAITPMRTERLAEPILLLANGSRHSYHRRANLQTLAADIARDYGLTVSFDPDLKNESCRVDVDDASFADAMRVLGLVSNTMFVPLDEHSILLAEETSQNHTRLDRLVEQAYYLPGVPPDQIRDYVSIAQTVLGIPKVSVAPTQDTVIVRSPADLADAADRLFTDLLAGDSDVVYDLKLYSINHSNARNLGVVLPTSFTAFNVASQAQSIVSANSSLIDQLIANGVLPPGLSNIEIAAYLVFVAGVSNGSSLLNTFLTFGGGLTMTGVSLGASPVFNLALSSTDAHELDNIQLRAGNRQTSTFKSGMRYPIQTSLYSDIATSTAGNTSVNGVNLSSLLSQYLGTSSITGAGVVPQVQYEDIGLTVTTKPVIQRSGDVATHLEVKITSLAGNSLNGLPVLNSRLFSSDLMLHDGETTMMVSETDRSEYAAVSGIPGLSEIPGFQGSTNKNSSMATGEVVLLVTPHVVRQGHMNAAGPLIPLQSHPDSDN